MKRLFIILFSLMCFCGHSSAQMDPSAWWYIFEPAFEAIGDALNDAYDDYSFRTTEHIKDLNEGVRCYQEGFYDDAIKHLLLVNETDKDYPRVLAWSTLAHCYYKKHYYTKAQGYIDKVKSFEKSITTRNGRAIDSEKERVRDLETQIKNSRAKNAKANKNTSSSSVANSNRSDVSKNSGKEVALSIAKLLGQDCPINLGDGIELTSVTAEANNVVYLYSVELSGEYDVDDVITDEGKPAAVQSLLQSAKTDKEAQELVDLCKTVDMNIIYRYKNLTTGNVKDLVITSSDLK